MLMPNSVLILLSRYSLLYSAIREFSSRSGSPRKHHHLEKQMDGMDDDDWLFRAERGGNLCTNTWRTRSESCALSGRRASRHGGTAAFVCICMRIVFDGKNKPLKT